MGLQTECTPDSADRRLIQTDDLNQRPRAPVSRVSGLRLQRRRDDSLYLRVGNLAGTTWSGLVEQAVESFLEEACSPFSDRHSTEAQPLSQHHIRFARASASQDDARSLGKGLTRRAAPDPGFELATLFTGQMERFQN
jgi:hypothetical protein